MKPKPKLSHPDHGTPTVCSYFDCSTGFLADIDHSLLEKFSEDFKEETRDTTVPRIIPHRYGWWVNVQWTPAAEHSNDRELFVSAGFSAKFMRLFDAAAAAKCNWINLDRDAG